MIPTPDSHTPGDRHRPRHRPVHGGGRARRGGHRGVCLLLARLRGGPGSRRGRGHRPARAGHDRRPGLRQFDGGAVRRPAPGAGPLPGPPGCSRWESPLPSRQTWPRAGPTVPSGRWSRPGRRSASWAHTNFWSGSSAPPGRQTANRRQSTCALARPAVPRRVLARPQPLMASASEGASAARQTRRGGPRVRPPGSRPSPPAGSVTVRCLRPALSMTRRWLRTGSACRPATRCRNAGSPRCSDAPPAAGREPESPMHDRHRRSPTRRAPRSRHTRKQGRSGSLRNAIESPGFDGGFRCWLQLPVTAEFELSRRLRIQRAGHARSRSGARRG